MFEHRIIANVRAELVSALVGSASQPQAPQDSHPPGTIYLDPMRYMITGLLLLISHFIEAQSLKLISEELPVITPAHPDIIKTKNKSGFETGQVIKLGNTYHMFVNEMFNRPHLDLRIAHWTSTNATNWTRRGTVMESIPGRSPHNPKSEVWVTSLIYNGQEDAWNIFYVQYRGGDSTKGEIARADYQGRIWRAKSIIPGRDGINGPYADMGIVLQPDEDSQPWEGQQAIASFAPYQVNNTWYAIYDGHNHIPRGPWPDGMAFSKSLEGPWKRMPEGINPLNIVDSFAENHVISKLRNGTWMMVFDSMGDQEIGYSTSKDGVHWEHEKRIKIQKEKIWAENGDHSMRTPLCAIEEEDGSFTVLYTALTIINGEKFYALGKCQLAWDQ